jgi:hypothetical protein
MTVMSDWPVMWIMKYAVHMTLAIAYPGTFPRLIVSERLYSYHMVPLNFSLSPVTTISSYPYVYLYISAISSHRNALTPMLTNDRWILAQEVVDNSHKTVLT